MKRMVSIVIVVALLASIIPLYNIPIKAQAEQRVLNVEEMNQIMGGFDTNPKPTPDPGIEEPKPYKYEKVTSEPSLTYGTAELKLWRKNSTGSPMPLEIVVIDRWYIRGEVKASTTVKTVFNLGANFVGEKFHEERTTSSTVIRPGYQLKIFTKPYTETTTYKYKTLRWDETTQKYVLVNEDIGHYYYSSKLVNYVEGLIQ